VRVPQTLKDLMSPRCSWDWSRAHRTFLYSTCAYLRCICISPISPTIIIVIFWLFVSICYVSQLLFVIGVVTSLLWVLLLLLFVVICYTYYWCRNRGCTPKLKKWETGDERMRRQLWLLWSGKMVEEAEWMLRQFVLSHKNLWKHITHY